MIRLVFNQFDDADGERRMASSLDRLILQDKQDDVEILIKDTLNLKPLLSIEAQSLYAKLVYEKFPESRILQMINIGFGDPYSYHKLLEPLVLRLENTMNLHMVNAGFGDPYSYHRLLEALVSRLENITNLHKGIKW
jgi:ATP-dependent DNA helicase RecQ